MHLIPLLLLLSLLSPHSSFASPNLTPHQLLHSSPSRPLGLIKHLHSNSHSHSHPQHPTPLSYSPDASQHHFSPPSHQYTPHLFPQRISHDPLSPYFNQTFLQRYWFDNRFYEEGGPIFFLDGGETDGEGRLNFLREGILRVLAEATGGMGVIHEHRFYGTSHPFSNLSISSLSFLTTNQSLLDSAHFARTILFPGMESQKLTARDVPWVYYGGSYAGGKSAFARIGWGWEGASTGKGAEGVWWGAIASSGVTVAIVDYWQYYETIRTSASPSCISLLLNHTSLIDSLISLHNPLITSSLKNYFGLKDLTRIEDFVGVLSIPLGMWQGRNWDPNLDGGGWEEFCESVKTTTSASAKSLNRVEEEEDEAFLSTIQESLFPGLPKIDFSSFSSYAKYIKENIVALCPEGETQDDCFGIDGYASNTGLEEAPWRSWLWQVCTEWGYFMPAPPEEEREKGLISKFITLEYTMEICKKAYGIVDLPDVRKVNAFGGYEIEAERLAFVDGSADPWIYATPHSPLAKHPNRTSTLSKPFHLIPGAVHHWDENSLMPSTNPKIPSEIKEVHEREVEWVKSWVEEWRERGRWKIDPEPDPGGGF